MKTTVQLSHPAAMELILRKRIAANIYNKQVIIHILLLILFYIPNFMDVFLAACFILHVSRSYEK